MIKFVPEFKYGVGGVIVKYLYQELLVSTQENPWSITSPGKSQYLVY